MGRLIRGASPYLLGVSESFGPTFDQNGEWDRIVCRRCEDSFNAADTYFRAFFDRLSEGAPVSVGNHPARVFRDADPVMIQRFGITCLYRAALSSKYPKVSLGPRLRELGEILRAPPALSDRFPTILFVEQHKHADVIIYPGVMSIEGVRFYRMIFPSLSINVQVDSRPTPRASRPLLLRAGHPVLAPYFDDPPLSTVRVLEKATTAHSDRVMRMTRRLREKDV